MMPTVTTPIKRAISGGFNTLRKMIASGVEIAITDIMNAKTVPKAAPLESKACTIGMIPAALL